MKKLSKEITALVKLVDEALVKELPKKATRPKQIHAGMHYAVFPGGKRLRPVMCLAAAKAINAKGYKKAILPAVAIELLHSYTLVHDDLPAMDNDFLRRGKSTVHVKFGEGAAVLIGDALLTFAFEVLAKAGNVDLIKELTVAAGSEGVIGGQMEDLDLQEKKKKSSKALLEYIFTKKTATLFMASVRMGGISQGATPAQLIKLTAYAKQLGIAFQFIDDLLDDDKNLLKVYTQKQARIKAEQLVEAALNELKDLPGDITFLQEIAEVVISQLDE